MKVLARLCSFLGGSRRESLFLLPPSLRGYSHSLAYGTLFHLQSTSYPLLLSLLQILTFLPPFSEDPSDESIQIIQGNLISSRSLIQSTSKRTLLPSKVTYSQVLGIRRWTSLVIGRENHVFNTISRNLFIVLNIIRSYGKNTRLGLW